ncbi:unnamed protein product [Cercopithifilaria johnstoni]|uniref:Gustatory receptor n=1 Tax=Cercopithifilaria johnstoni TaxID=2874296 RepID=A0A8J2ME79_9BILA|nr:unnamed protein product [Cercopithifilaria johnstoni]
MNRSYCIIVLFLILPPLNCHNGNMTDIFDIRDDYNMSKKYVATTLFSLILLYGIVGNILLTAVFCSRDNMYSRPFICIAIQIIICSILNFVTQVTIVIPEIVKKKISYWLSAIEFNYCIKSFNVPNLQWSLNCTNNTSENGEVFKKIRHVWILGLPIAMFAIYIAIFYNIRQRRKSCLKSCKSSGYKAKVTDKYERLMLMQSAIVCGALEIEIICFHFLLQLAVKLAGNKVEIPVNIFINCYVIFTGALLPTINFIFIKKFRKNVKRVILELSSKITNNKKAAIVPTILAT